MVLRQMCSLVNFSDYGTFLTATQLAECCIVVRVHGLNGGAM